MSDAAAFAVNETPTRALRNPAVGPLAAPIATATPIDAPLRRNACSKLSNYELGEPIGAGGMGTVYKAIHTWLGRPVAVKFIAKEALGDPDAVARFAHEILAIGTLDHANIVRATDAGCVGGAHFLVTEFVDGCDLARLVKAAGPLRTADACEIIRQAALGLQHAHEQRLVHRDVKPSNLLLSRDGVVKLVDFGLARFASSQTALTTTGQMIGTLDYLAPEQAADARQVDIRSDIYSLGCTFYFLLAGQAPFSGPEYGTPASKIRAHLADQPPAPVGRRQRIPLAVRECLERMMAKAPVDRYQTPDQIATALAPHVRGANLPRLVSLATGASSVAASTAAGQPMWSGCLRLGGSLPALVGWTLRRLCSRRTSFQASPRREPIVSISGLIALMAIGLIFSHFSCRPHEMPRQFRDIRNAQSGPEVHYFRIGSDPADHP